MKKVKRSASTRRDSGPAHAQRSDRVADASVGPWDRAAVTSGPNDSSRALRRVPQLNRISVQTLNERAYVELRNAIMAARLLPGEAISLRGLANPLGTSPQPIRDRGCSSA